MWQVEVLKIFTRSGANLRACRGGGSGSTCKGVMDNRAEIKKMLKGMVRGTYVILSGMAIGVAVFIGLGV